MKTGETVRSGYRLEKVYAVGQEYRLLESEGLSDSEGESQVAFGWDWHPIGPRQFEVLVEVSLDPSAERPEEASARLCGVFTAGASLSMPFKDFLGNAPAILFPYAREIISSMTGRGPFGAFHVDPLNIKAIIGPVNLKQTDGYRQLFENPAMAGTFELCPVSDTQELPAIPGPSGG